MSSQESNHEDLLREPLWCAEWVGRWSGQVGRIAARTLGNLADPRSVDSLVATLDQCLPEGSLGYPDPTSPSAMFLQKDFTPCYRAVAAWALGQIGDRRAGPILLAVIGNLNNATDTRGVAGPPERSGQCRGRPNAGVHLSRGFRAQSPLAPVRQAGPLSSG